jgi:hypothetical protein
MTSRTRVVRALMRDMVFGDTYGPHDRTLFIVKASESFMPRVTHLVSGDELSKT